MSNALLSLVLMAAAQTPYVAPSSPSDSSAVHSPSGPPAVHAVRLTEPVTIDGILSEAVWHSDYAVTNFTQSDPVEGAPPSQRTEVRVAFDDDAIYVGARMYDTAPDSILARLSRRDVSIPADRFSIYLDPYHDRRSGYYFLVNAAGTLFDGTLSNDGWEDNSWDGVWSAHTHLDREGWTLEMRIPYSQLRFQKSEHYVWGVNFRRVIPRRNEEDLIVYQPKKESGFVSRFPDLVGVENVRPGSSIEIIPYLTTKAEYLHHSALDPFNDGSKYDPNGGGDLRMSMGSRLTLNGTINPDFGQVEVDPAVVNLSDVESYFQEKRPFFVEGASNFRFGNEGANDYWGFNWPEPTFFYSRRVGRAPQGSLPDVDYQDVPVGTSILGAAKLTGKIAPSWNFGTLHALTSKEMARLESGGFRSNTEVEPLTYYGVARTQKEFARRQQGLGFMTTLASRFFKDSNLADQLNSQSLMTGLDGWVFLDRDQTWVISGYSAMSYVRGNSARMTALQEDPRHYFQRPDADHVEIDPNATSLTGYVSRYWLNKQKGSAIFNAALGAISPKFDINDVGFQSRADVINGHIGGGYKWTQPGKIKKYQNVLGAVFASYDFQGNPIWGGVWTKGNTEFTNNYSWNYSFAYNPQTVNNRRTRGGPLTLNRPGYELGTYFDTDSKKRFFYYLELGSYSSESGSWNWYASPGVEWKPKSNVLVRVGPNYSRDHEDAQYVTTYDDPAAVATFGKSYVFGVLDQTTVSADVRLNWAFTPNFSLQTFVQPLISSGDYFDFKALARPRSYSFTPIAYADNPDFNFKSLRGNAVLRWEYMPGATVYLAWTQQRTDSEDNGEFHFGRDCRRLIKANADNILLAKVTYYFNR